MVLWRHFCAVSADSAGAVVTGLYPSDFLIATGKSIRHYIDLTRWHDLVTG
jgi:hypothetical protein